MGGNRAVITVIGKDTVGILAKVSGICAKNNINVQEVTQSIMQNLFVMIMLVDIEKSSLPFTEFSDIVTGLGKRNEFINPCHA